MIDFAARCEVHAVNDFADDTQLLFGEWWQASSDLAGPLSARRSRACSSSTVSVSFFFAMMVSFCCFKFGAHAVFIARLSAVTHGSSVPGTRWI